MSTTRNHDLTGSRILAVMPSVPLQGMERANLQIMRLVKERGAHVMFVMEANWGQQVQAEVEAQGYEWKSLATLMTYEERLHLTARPREMAGVALAWLRAAKGLVRICRNYQPTHIYVTNFTYFLYAVPMLVLARVPVVFRLPNPPGIEGRGLRGALRRRLWQIVVSMSDVIVCNSRHSLERLQVFGLRSGQARLIYNCVPQRSDRGTSDTTFLGSDRFNVLYLGRIRPEKGVGELFEAAVRITQDFPHVDFLLAGEHSWRNEFAIKLQERIAQAGLQTRIRLLGVIEDVAGLLDRSKLHVCPSTSSGESFPNVVLEAKSRGLPSVVFPTAGLPEAVTHLVDGFVCSATTHEALATGIRFFIEHEEERCAIGLAAAKSLERFAPTVIGRQWAEVFDVRGSKTGIHGTIA